MRNWRLKWLKERILSREFHNKLKRELRNPNQFYSALAATLPRKSAGKGFKLQCQDGTTVTVREFMNLFIFDEVFVDGFYDVLQPHQDEATIVDVGGNHGYFSLRMKQLLPKAKVFTFEPNPENFGYLQENLKNSPHSNIHAFNRGIGAHTRIERLYIHPTNIGGHSIIPEFEGQPFDEIDILGIKEFIDQHKLNSIDLLKLDCEGAEHEIIMALGQEEADRIKTIIYEPTPRLYNPEETNQHLRQLGFRIREGIGTWIAER